MRKIFAMLWLFPPVLMAADMQPFEAANPLIADGSVYTADPAPFVADGKLYVLTGIDEAEPDINDFVMPAWALFETDNPGGTAWKKQVPLLKPEAVFSWAQPARAYAGQIFPAQDGMFYLFAPVKLKEKQYDDNFAIGVAVAPSPQGPWTDAIGKPLVDQGVAGAGDLQNIDPTIWQDDSGKITMIWGTFGELRGVELTPDMRSLKGNVRTLTGATGFFEAPWLLERNGTYYLFYAANNRKGGIEAGCSPTLYHACIAWATADSPLGEWHYQGVMLPPVSSTTSHPGIVQYHNDWWLFYHTADGKNGGTFRRSVARDKLTWDDSVSPATPMVTSTSISHNTHHKTGNKAYSARVTSSSTALPIRFWLDAVNNGKVRNHPLPPELWSTEGSDEGTSAWLQYRFKESQSVAKMRFNHISYNTAGTFSWTLEALINSHWDTVTSGKVSTDSNWVEARFGAVDASEWRLRLPVKDSADEYILIQEWELY